MSKIMLISLGPWQSLMGMVALERSGFDLSRCEAYVLLAADRQDLFAICEQIHSAFGLSLSYHVKMGNDCKPYEILMKAQEKRFNDVFAPGLGTELIFRFILNSDFERIFLFEDGLHSTDPDWVYNSLGTLRDQTRLRQLISKIRYQVFKSGTAHLHKLKRKLSGICFFMDTQIHSLGIDLLQITNERLLKGIQRVSKHLELDKLESESYSLILGSNFANCRECTISEEIGVLEEAICRLSKETKVLWKPHPRTDPLLTDYLRLKTGVETIPTNTMNFPIELLVAHNPPVNIVSIMSSSLIYCAELFGSKPIRLTTPKMEEMLMRGRWKVPYAYLSDRTVSRQFTDND